MAPIMKRLLLASLALIAMQSGMAQSFDYLTFDKTDGTSVSLSASGLTLTFSDGNLLASDGTTIPLASLSKMYFSQTSGISLAQTKTGSILEGTVSVYSTTGALVGTFDSQAEATGHLTQGVYLFKDQKGHTLKAVIRK